MECHGKITSLWRWYGHTWNFATGTTFRHQVLMWDVNCDSIQGGKGEERQEGEKGREARHKILNMHASRAGSKRLDVFAFAYIWDKYDTVQPGLPSHLSSVLLRLWGINQTHPGPRVLQVFWDEGRLAVRNELLARVQGMMKSLVGARLSQRQLLTPLDLWRSPRLWSGTITFSPKMHPTRAGVYLLGWHLCAQTAGLAKSTMSRHKAWKD